MQQAIDIANKNADKARRLNKTTYYRKLYGNDLNVGANRDEVVPANSVPTGKILSKLRHKKQKTYLFTTSSQSTVMM